MSDLGAFSVSLPVKDLAVSVAFYEKLGFEAAGGGEGWQIMRMGDKVIGLFQGMFDQPMLTFNPGWTQGAETLESFADVRDLQKAFRAKGLELSMTCDEAGKGPANIMLSDPDGHPILIDQHV